MFHDGSAKLTTGDLECMVCLKKFTFQKFKANRPTCTVAVSCHKRLDALLYCCVGIPRSRLVHSMWDSWWTKWALGRFFSGFLQFFPTTDFIPTFLHTHSFHFTIPCDGAIGVVSRNPCYSLNFNTGASLHLIPRPRPVSDTSRGCYLFLHIPVR